MRQDEGALLEEMYEQYLVPLKKYAAKIGVPFDDIEDIVQETFIEYYERYGLDWPAKTKTALLIRILRSKWIDGDRKKRRYQLLRIDDPEDEKEILRELMESNAMLELLEQDIIDREFYQELWDFIKQMKKIWRDIVVLRIIEGRSTEETSAILEIPGTVCRSRLARARKELRRRFKKSKYYDY